MLRDLKKIIIPVTLFACFDHFKLTCFQHDSKALLMGIKPRRLPIYDAVPTIFEHSQSLARKRVSSIDIERKKLRNKLSKMQKMNMCGFLHN